jgi:hypothetical protein
MTDKIDKYKLVVNRFTAEIEKSLDRNLRTFVTVETEIYDVSHPDNNDGTFDEVAKAKLVGSTIIKQQGQKDFLVGKSKRTQSQKLRAAIWSINPDEEFYTIITDKIILNIEEIIEFLKNK